MSNVTNSVIEEMKSELLERLNDKDEKIHTVLTQTQAFLCETISAFSWILGSFIRVMLIAIVFFFLILSPEVLVDIRSASDESILSLVDTIISFGWTMVIMMTVFSFALGRRRFRNIQKEKEQAIHERVEFVADVAVIAEEILHRHELIDLGEEK